MLEQGPGSHEPLYYTDISIPAQGTITMADILLILWIPCSRLSTALICHGPVLQSGRIQGLEGSELKKGS